MTRFLITGGSLTVNVDHLVYVKLSRNTAVFVFAGGDQLDDDFDGDQRKFVRWLVNAGFGPLCQFSHGATTYVVKHSAIAAVQHPIGGLDLSTVFLHVGADELSSFNIDRLSRAEVASILQGNN